MPKRPKSPPPDPDEPHHLAVFYPYLSNGNLDSVEDRHHTARWLACCIGKDDLLALFHRPGAKSTIIIEILKNPTADQRSVASKVFFCRLSTQSKVKKAGWKRIDVEEHWFKGWDPEHGVFTFPYPSTYRCEPPPEADPVHKNLCLNLPVQHFPVPEPARPPPVGSPEWLARKQAGTWSTSKPRSKAVKNALASSPQLVMPTPSRPAAVPPATVLARGTSAGPSAPSPVTPISPANACSYPVPFSPVAINESSQGLSRIPVPPGFVPRNGASPAADAFPPPPGLSRTPSNASPALNASPELSSSEGDSTGWWSPTAIEADGASPVTPFVQEPGRFEQVMAGLAFEDDHEYEQEEWGDHGPPDLWAAPAARAGAGAGLAVAGPGCAAGATGDEQAGVQRARGRVQAGICEVWAKQKREFDWEEKQRERQRERPRKGKGQGRDEGAHALLVDDACVRH
ncbi:hypothetical protein B0H21DRAFT_765908 [Amylocystis lapponica]|nr:hypothetical protein B0H21DRAFT_765908 [Amylocystis lapponica]